MGVVTGVVLSYEVASNWSRFADITGNVLGPLLIYEVLSAFFLEATSSASCCFAGTSVALYVDSLREAGARSPIVTPAR
jgi:cytochrome d ubiquinol oxidase subunit I